VESPPKGQADGTFGQVAPERLGKYPLLSVIGTGSMGIVYKSYDPELGRAIALKTIRRELLDDEIENFPARFRIEAEAAGGLTHPCIVTVYEHGEAEGYAYIAMEYVEGHNLRDCVESKVRFNTDQTINIVSQLLKALQHAHEHGVWHRDVKPANILLVSDGLIKVTDFGIARVESLTLAQADAIMGTPGFIAPEMYLGEEFDHRIDLFAAGVVFYQLLAGVAPFVGTPEKVMFKVCYETPLPASVIARQPSLRPFDAVVLKALARRPDDRFSSAAEFLEALLLAQAGGPVAADATVIVARRSTPVSGAPGADQTLIIPRRQAEPNGPAGADETVMVSLRPSEAAEPASADKTLIKPRRPSEVDDPPRADPTLWITCRPTEAGDPANADKTLMMPRRPSEAGDAPSADKTLIMPRRPGEPSEPREPPRVDDTLWIQRRSDPDEANYTLIRPSSTDHPVTQPLSPPEPLETHADESAISQPQSTNTPSQAPGWNAQELSRIERQLAHFVGPVAGVLVRSGTRETGDLVSLIRWLAAKLRNAQDRAAFLSSSGVTVASALGLVRSDSETKASSTPADGGAVLTPEYIARASKLLAVYLGPIATVLAKRAAQPGSSQEQFVDALAAHLSDDRERTRFLRALA
jgi:serine/threonine protein kinase